MIAVLKTLVHLAAALPLVWLYYGAVNDTIGADPVERVIHFTGIGALNILLISLIITPLAKRFKKPVLLKFRRLLGLWAFTYALFHLLNFLFFELQFDWRLFIDEVIDRPYITVGMFAFAILVPLAVTSWSKVKRKMGKSWQQLHNWVYIAAVAIWVHFYWSIKSDIYEPGLYAVGLIWLLSLRKDRISRWLFKRK
ncbi:protein-methionine-sulfoxide reductase heme-binding subunit MsrQ [Thalassotalea euphylliae]|uniref:Protein-methionine-sulfoxide reductase heme-binding subunit MsrQ n=1 Tax=Thalassotalea euphylliae TaxID=1655234 RepID=A0A3E0UDF1_9GAMM|nr:protein-methionine-sulfoxide reductase heme-binding subunit MsrQ [Thalassotalea euphylliae]REL34744.1 protein-methionine-sulfoxide reductase heme-binding subunit MsrQ [Thalassotalea euphylliae]